MTFRRTKPAPPVKPGRERAALVAALAESGEVVPSACGACGASVPVDEPGAVQTHGQRGRWPHTAKTRSWRYHGVCHAAQGRTGRTGDRGGPAALLALMLSPGARPVVVRQAHVDVARTLGVPLRYEEVKNAAASDSGQRRGRFQHVPRADLEEVRAAVEKRHQELTVPVLSPSAWPCSVCGTSHELLDRWGEHQHQPTCGACSRLIERAMIPGNGRLAELALDAARPSIPADRDINRFRLAHEMAGYRPLGPDERREAWAYLLALPEWPLTPEEALTARLADLESRMAAA